MIAVLRVDTIASATLLIHKDRLLFGSDFFILFSSVQCMEIRSDYATSKELFYAQLPHNRCSLYDRLRKFELNRKKKRPSVAEKKGCVSKINNILVTFFAGFQVVKLY